MRIMIPWTAPWLALALFALTAPAAADVSTVRSQAQGPVSLTVYSDGMALVGDRRQVQVPQGTSRIAFEQIGTGMLPETVLVESADDTAPLAIRARSFHFDLLTPAALLQHAVGSTVRVIRTNPATGEESVETAEVLSAANGTVLLIGDRIETGVPGRLVFDALPPGLTERPTLAVTVESDAAREAAIDLRYMTGGLGWRADYVASLAPDGQSLELSGLATITNTSGVAFRDAAVRVVAGSVNRVSPPPRPLAAGAAMQRMAADESVPAAQAVADLHLYPLPGRISLGERETRQQALVGPVQVPVARTYRLEGGGMHTGRQDEPVHEQASVRIGFTNDSASNLGIPLPRGIMRIYGAAEDGPVFLGEDGIQHTAAGQDLRLDIGRAFDVGATRRQTDFQATGMPRRTFESAYSIELRNAKSEPVEVNVVEHIPGDWTMLQESLAHEKPSAGVARWTVAVPAEGTATLTYRVRVQLQM